MTEKKRKKYTFRYQLSYQEAYNAFMALGLRWGKKFQYGIMGFTVLLTLIIMAMFIIHPERFYYFVIIIFAVILTAYVFYSPVLKAKNGAKRVAKLKGTYEVSLSSDGFFSLAGGEERELASDKHARALELADSFAIRADAVTILCIPKKIMTDAQKDSVRDILKEYLDFGVYE